MKNRVKTFQIVILIKFFCGILKSNKYKIIGMKSKLLQRKLMSENETNINK